MEKSEYEEEKYSISLIYLGHSAHMLISCCPK